MKKIALLLMALSTTALASAEVPMKEVCAQLAEVAQVTMTARQSGVPVRSMMEIAVDETIVDMVTEAYSTPSYNTPKNQDRAIQDFEDQWYLRCIKSYNL